jgi:hypothetical protein
MVDLNPSENLNVWNLLSVRHFVYKLLFHVQLPRFGNILIWIMLPYVEWDWFVTLAGSKSGLRVRLSYLCEYEPRSCQTKEYTIGICCFSARNAALRRKSKDWLARNQNNVSEWSDISTQWLLLAHLAKGNVSFYHHLAPVVRRLSEQRPEWFTPGGFLS